MNPNAPIWKRLRSAKRKGQREKERRRHDGSFESFQPNHNDSNDVTENTASTATLKPQANHEHVSSSGKKHYVDEDDSDRDPFSESTVNAVSSPTHKNHNPSIANEKAPPMEISIVQFSERKRSAGTKEPVRKRRRVEEKQSTSVSSEKELAGKELLDLQQTLIHTQSALRKSQDESHLWRSKHAELQREILRKQQALIELEEENLQLRQQCRDLQDQLNQPTKELESRPTPHQAERDEPRELSTTMKHDSTSSHGSWESISGRPGHAPASIDNLAIVTPSSRTSHNTRGTRDTSRTSLSRKALQSIDNVSTKKDSTRPPRKHVQASGDKENQLPKAQDTAIETTHTSLEAMKTNSKNDITKFCLPVGSTEFKPVDPGKTKKSEIEKISGEQRPSYQQQRKTGSSKKASRDSAKRIQKPESNDAAAKKSYKTDNGTSRKSTTAEDESAKRRPDTAELLRVDKKIYKSNEERNDTSDSTLPKSLRLGNAFRDQVTATLSVPEPTTPKKGPKPDLSSKDSGTLSPSLQELSRKKQKEEGKPTKPFLKEHRTEDEVRPDYKYQEVVRNREERRALPGHTCPECKAFVDVLCNAPGGDVFNRDHLMDCSRHRARHTPPQTPEGFWELSFADEIEDRNREMESDETSNTANK